jgi:hypothetical protein
MHNYCTPHIITENFENFLIRPCNYILLSQVYCVWQVVKTPTIIFNNPVFPGEKRRSVSMASNLTSFMFRLSRNPAASTFWNPQDLYRDCFIFTFIFTTLVKSLSVRKCRLWNFFLVYVLGSLNISKPASCERALRAGWIVHCKWHGLATMHYSALWPLLYARSKLYYRHNANTHYWLISSQLCQSNFIAYWIYLNSCCRNQWNLWGWSVYQL